MSHSEINQLEKITGNSPEAKSLDITQQNIEQLKQLFPEVFSENKIDFEALKAVLGEAVDDSAERYNFTWNGKTKARQIAQTPSTGTLRPCKQESVNWDTTENLFIEGDNLEVLKLLQKSYHKKVKMIYIDPPYNTGTDFIYKDNFKDNIQNYLTVSGQLDENGRKISTNSEFSGRYHSDWLNMIYPRLKLARNLLTDDGAIFISIDDNEIGNLRKICDEIFGESNFVAELCWEKKKKGTFLSNSLTNIKESILVYTKNMDAFNGLIGEIKTDTETYPCINASNKREVRTIPKGIISKYRDSNAFLPKGSEISVTTMSLILHSDLVIKDNVLAEDLVIEGNWRYTQDKMERYALEGNLYITQDLYLRRIVNDARYKTLKDLLPRVGTNVDLKYSHFNIDNLFEDGWGSNEDGEEEFRLLMKEKGILEFPKPTKLIKKLITSIRDDSCIVLDFFAGSGTTAHSVMQLNAEDKGNRKFIVVQLPEVCNELSNAYKSGYKTIAEITKERIRRAGNDVKGMHKTVELDVGFKVLKLDETNILPWDANFGNLELVLQQATESIKDGRSSEDVLYEIFLKYGYDLTTPVKTETVNGKIVYIVGAGALIVCLDDDITAEVVEGIAKLKEKLDPETTQVVFKDAGFADSNVKTNAIQILKQAGIDDVKSI